MKRLDLSFMISFMIVLSTLFLLPLSAMDTIQVKQTKIPVLIEREDNVLFYLRIDEANAQILSELKFQLADNVDLNEIESIKLYYGGTESVQRANEVFFSPVEYISSYSRGSTLKANPSYSIKVAELREPKSEVVLSPNYKLFFGINYFWVSLQMKPTASLLSKINIELKSAKLDYNSALLEFESTNAPHRMGGLE